jgi:hypothetical protein
MDKIFLDRLREGMRIDGQDDQGESILHFQDLLVGLIRFMFHSGFCPVYLFMKHLKIYFVAAP